MALVLADRVRETTTTTGTGSVTLAGAYTGFQTFSAAVGTGNSTYYTIANVGSGEWEVGIGTYTSGGNTLSRTTVLASSNGGSLVNFGAGAKDVFVTQPAERALYVASAGTGLESKVTAFTNGGIVYASSTSALATGSALSFDGSNLGVGNAPAAWSLSGLSAVQVKDVSLAGFSNAMYLNNNVYYNGGWKFIGTGYGLQYIADRGTGAYTWEISTASGTAGNAITFTTAMTLNASGRFGLGITPNTTWGTGWAAQQITGLSVASSGVGTYQAFVMAGNAVMTGTTASSVAANYVYSDFATMYRQTTGQHQWWNAGAGTGGNAISFTQAMTLDASGNLLIGVTDTNIPASANSFNFNKSDNTLRFTNTTAAGKLWTIGTSSPGVSAQGDYFSFTHYNGSSLSEFMRLDSSGNLGLGVTPSAWDTVVPAFQIGGAGGYIAAQGSAEVLRIGSNNYYNSSAFRYVINGSASRYDQSGGAHAWFNAASGTAGNAITFTQAMTLSAGGNLVIGDTSGNGRLSVRDSSSALQEIYTTAGTNYAALEVRNTGGSFYIGRDNSAGSFFVSNTAYASCLYSSGAYPMVFFTNGTERARIDSSGNLGLGVTPSAWNSGYKAFVTGGTNGNNQVGGIASGSGITIVSTNYYRSSTPDEVYGGTGFAMKYVQSSGQHQFHTAASGTINTPITFTQAMTLDASGNLGLGVTPSGWGPSDFTVSQYGLYGVYFGSYKGSSTPNLFLGTNSYFNGSTWKYTTTDEAGRYQIDNAGQHIWSNAVSGTAGTDITWLERMRIDSSGNLLVGTTDSSDTANAGFRALPSGVATSTLTASGTGDSTMRVYSTGAGAYRFFVRMDGTIFATSIVITAISDERLKENVRDIDTGLNSIMSLKPRRFDWKDGKGQDKKNAAGFIAQEFEDVFPECVGTSKAGADGIEYKSINHETLIPTLVKAIQEQQALITQLTARITALEGA